MERRIQLAANALSNRRHRRADRSGCQIIEWIVGIGLILGRIQRHGLLHRQQPIQGIEGIRMGQRRADDGGRQRSIDHLGEGVVGEVGIAAIHAVRQPFLFESAAGVVPVALGQPLAHRAVVRRPDAGQAAGGVVQIVGLISFAIGDFIQQAAGAVASIQVLPLEVIVERSPSPLNFCLEAHCGNARWLDRQYPCGFQGIHLCNNTHVRVIAIQHDVFG